MDGFEALFEDLKGQVVQLAQQKVKDCAADASAEANAFLERSKDKLKEWTLAFAENKIDKEEYEWLMNSQKGLGEMKVLTQAGLAQIKIDEFTQGVKAIALNTLLGFVNKLK